MIRVPAGSFLMGSPIGECGHRPNQRQHEVTIVQDFYLALTPVTQGQYAALTGERPTDFPDAGDDAPVDSVTWEQANEYCRLLTAEDREAGVLPLEYAYHLPSEAHWEYACRAGSPAARYAEPTSSIAWFSENSDFRTHPVAQKEANDWGFVDMLGNVFEWCQDWYYPEYDPTDAASVPSAVDGYPKRVARGGSWYNSTLGCRAAFREAFMPSNPGRYLGFRPLVGSARECSIGVGKVSLSYLEPLEGMTPEQELYASIAENDVSHVSWLLSEHEGLADYHDEIPPPLHWAVTHDKPEMVKLLIESGADLERPDMDRDATALGFAVVYARPKIIRILVKHGAKLDRLLATARKGAEGAFEEYGMSRVLYDEIVQLLLELGATER